LTNLCALLKISGIHAVYILIEKRLFQFKESQNFRLVNNAVTGQYYKLHVMQKLSNSNSYEKKIHSHWLARTSDIVDGANIERLRKSKYVHFTG